MQQNPVNPGHCDHRRIGRSLSLYADHAVRYAKPCIDILQHLSEGIRPRLGEQADVCPQKLHCDPGIGHRTASVDGHPLHLYQLTRCQQFSRICNLFGSGRKDRCEIKTGMPRHDHFFLFCSLCIPHTIPPIYIIIVHITLPSYKV